LPVSVYSPAASYPANVLTHNGDPNTGSDASTDNVGADINADSSANSVDIDDVHPNLHALQHTDVYIIYNNDNDYPDGHPEHHGHHIGYYNRHGTGLQLFVHWLWAGSERSQRVGGGCWRLPMQLHRGCNTDASPNASPNDGTHCIAKYRLLKLWVPLPARGLCVHFQQSRWVMRLPVQDYNPNYDRNINSDNDSDHDFPYPYADLGPDHLRTHPVTDPGPDHL